MSFTEYIIVIRDKWCSIVKYGRIENNGDELKNKIKF